jgi:ketosteroid isomerase-like protein
MQKHPTLRSPRVAVVFGAAAVVLPAGIMFSLRADEHLSGGPKEPTKLAKDLIGTWVLMGTPDKVGARLKFFTGKHWVVTQAEPETGKVVLHHGGTYTLDGDNYAETIEYANESTADLIKKTYKFKIKVEGNTYTQIGDGNPYSEVWKRATLVGASVAPAEERHALRKLLEASQARVAEAFKKKDIKMFMEGGAPDFTLKGLNGKVMTREQVEAAVKRLMDRIKSVNELRVEVGDITITGDTAVVVTTQHFSRVIAGPDGKDHTVVTSGTMHRETYVKTAAGWKIKQVEETKQGKEIVDGEPAKRP